MRVRVSVRVRVRDRVKVRVRVRARVRLRATVGLELGLGFAHHGGGVRADLQGAAQHVDRREAGALQDLSVSARARANVS